MNSPEQHPRAEIADPSAQGANGGASPLMDALRRRTEEVAVLLNALPVFIWTSLDAECRVITGNRAANELVGIPAGTNVSQTAVAHGEAIYLKQLKEDGTEYRVEELPLQRAIALGQAVHDQQIDFCFADGRRVQVLGNAVPLLDENGRPRGGIAAFVDVTERKRGEQALRRNEALFSTILDQAPGGVYVVDEHFCMRQINALARPTFAAAEPVLGRDFAEIMRILWGEEVGGKITAIFRHTLETGERCISPQFSEQRADLLKEKSYAWETQRLTLPNGRYGVVCYFTDTTEQRALEAALRASEARATGIIQSIDDGFVTMDAAWRITYLSTRGAEILAPLQKTTSSVLGKSFWEEFPGSAGTQLELEYRRAMREQVAVRFENYYQPLDRWFDIRAYPSPATLTVYFLDITERKQAEEVLRFNEQALAEQADALRAADHSKNEFLAMLAHELRNPLAPLRNATEILQSADANAEERDQAQRILARQLENMSRMIDDLLDVSRITEGKIELRRRVVSLEAILTSAASLVRSNCAAQRQELEVSLPRQPIYLRADSTRLEQVLSNLLNNACKYSGVGSRIALSAELTGDGTPPDVIIRVRDNGIGIDPELLPRVFELFVQASRTLDRAHGGLGIGLTLARRLVNLHGGTIEARSGGIGRGAEFLIRLPVTQDLPPAPPLLPPLTQETPRRILIVDDNSDAARTLAIIQKRRGHETSTAFTGPDAVSAAEQFLPEVVLLDIGLPGMDGFEVARRIRAIPGLAGAFIVAMSGYGSEDIREEATAAGFDEYLIKPADLDLLQSWLRERFPKAS